MTYGSNEIEDFAVCFPITQSAIAHQFVAVKPPVARLNKFG